MTKPSARPTPRTPKLGALAAAILLLPLIATSGGLRDAGFGDGTLIDAYGDYVYPQTDGTYLDINGNLYLPGVDDFYGPEDLGAADDLDSFSDQPLVDPLSIDPWAPRAPHRDYTRLDTFGTGVTDPLQRDFEDADVGHHHWSDPEALDGPTIGDSTDPSARPSATLDGRPLPGLAPEVTEDGRYLDVGTGYLDVGTGYQDQGLVSPDMPEPGLLDSEGMIGGAGRVPDGFDPITPYAAGSPFDTGDPIAWGEPQYRQAPHDSEMEIPKGLEIDPDIMRLQEARQQRIHADEVVSPGDLGSPFAPMLGN